MSERLLSNFSFAGLETCTVDETRVLRKKWNETISQGDVPSVNQISEEISNYFISESEVDAMKSVQGVFDEIEGIMIHISALADQKKKVYETMNIGRVKTIINEVPGALQRNIDLFENLLKVQQGLCNNVQSSLSRLRSGKNDTVLDALGKEMFSIMCDVLGNGEGRLKYEELINEQQYEHMNGIVGQLKDGYMFHFSVIDEMHTQSLAKLLEQQVPEEDRKINDHLMEKMLCVANAVNVAYNANWKIIAMTRKLFCIVKETVNRI
ncbi:hypothetical protein HN419_04160 [Candidatus Woesearchaeota archaeon]|jgi:hypothetical protein|nr:hypothetical protein [Candidatus Woesearchaeota archaeon]MBT3537929.1 hypothetical protein [Candidatus Woesearchaeota archaeon]MBT4698067.1 hypothetical protein [Candidatus Woesearchaeota archaeon]MBT4716520.1 hypothetical protein [Candidatus Woesearchaeota archaeon]MBT7105598.1 hypothetical protein [Candidatus Woesearchaeota archaeon]